MRLAEYLQTIYCSSSAVHSHLWLLYCKNATPAYRSVSRLWFKNLQPLNPRPPLLKHSQRSQLNLIGRLLTSDLGFVTEGIHPGRPLSCPTISRSIFQLLCKLPGALMLIEPVGALLCPHRRRPTPSPSTYHPSSSFALCYPARCLAPSPHNSVHSQHITGSPFHRRSALAHFPRRSLSAVSVRLPSMPSLQFTPQLRRARFHSRWRQYRPSICTLKGPCGCVLAQLAVSMLLKAQTIM